MTAIDRLLSEFQAEHEKLHIAWTAAVGTPDYIKAPWRDRDNALVRKYRDALTELGYPVTEWLRKPARDDRVDALAYAWSHTRSVAALRESLNLPPASEPSEVIAIGKAPTSEQVSAWLLEHVGSRDTYGRIGYYCKRCSRVLHECFYHCEPAPTDVELFKIALTHQKDCAAVTKTNIVIHNHYEISKEPTALEKLIAEECGDPAFDPRACLKCGARKLVKDWARLFLDCANCGATHEDRYFNGQLMLYACETCGANLRDVVAMRHIVHDPNANPQSRVVKTCGRKECEPANERPIKEGDYVRWERPSRDMWAEGEVIEIRDDRKSIRIDVKERGGKWRRCGSLGLSTFDGPYWDSVSLRRIPRPSKAQATAQQIVRRRGRCDLGCAEPCKHGLPYRVSEPAPPAPVLVDGITPIDCHMRWLENRLIIEGTQLDQLDLDLLHDLTPDQIAAAKAIEAAGRGARDSAALRAKVASSDEAERNRVRVDLQDEP